MGESFPTVEFEQLNYIVGYMVQAYFRDIVGVVTDSLETINVAVKRVTLAHYFLLCMGNQFVNCTMDKRIL